MREEGPQWAQPLSTAGPSSTQQVAGTTRKASPRAPRGCSDLNMHQTHGWAAEIRAAGPRPQSGARERACLTSSQELRMLLVWVTPFGCTASLRHQQTLERDANKIFSPHFFGI